jgi:lauroyl/myristoyl acyltransferase
MNAGWRLQWAAAGGRRAQMESEFRKCFGKGLTDQGYATLIEHSYRTAWRTHLEELLLGKLGPNTIDQWVQLKGLEHLDTALEQGRGVIWVYPHAGPVMLMIAGLAHNGFHYSQYAARGLAPPEIAKAHPDLLASNPLRESVRRVRENNENSLPVEYLTLDTPVRTLHRHLAENRIVGLAFDGRIGSGWWPSPFLNRTALLSSGPWKLACSTGATVLPIFCHSPQLGPAQVEIGAPIAPGKDWKDLAQRTLPVHEQWLRKHPEEYGLWLLHTLERAGIDDHPMFIDNAQDDRYTRWMPDEQASLR